MIGTIGSGVFINQLKSIPQTKERTRYITWAKTSEPVPIIAKGVRHICGSTTIAFCP